MGKIIYNKLDSNKQQLVDDCITDLNKIINPSNKYKISHLPVIMLNTQTMIVRVEIAEKTNSPSIHQFPISLNETINNNSTFNTICLVNGNKIFVNFKKYSMQTTYFECSVTIRYA